ncbi:MULTISPECIES: hypothetical protein [Priestia]|uniref:hypothetical protein n=1 Tax=Priestia TaxID=2800373 RepID=UPI0021D69114|nr:MULTISPECIES: hypothetical protein [Priestia]MCU7708827.1 hypothetical protein [Priestia megaterium]MCW1046374.1 hypothetical protein [Priestia sp. JV24]MDH3186587.1 hypothetical protein [Priestia megaterium]
MKKLFWSWGILIVVIISLAVGIPRITSNEASSLSSPEKKKQVKQLEKEFHQWSLRPLDKFMVQGYEVKPNGHQWDSVKQNSVKNYRVTYYTFFGIRYVEGEMGS